MILLYHKVYDGVENPPSEWWVRLETFKRQISQLNNLGYSFRYLDDYNPWSRSQFVITFDGLYKNCLPAIEWLHSLGIPCECFVSGFYIGLDNTFDKGEAAAQFCDYDDLKRVMELGGRIQWHGYAHKRLDIINDIGLELDAETSFRGREEFFKNGNLKWYAYPHGVVAFQSEVKKYFRGAVACGNGNMEYYSLKRQTMRETSWIRDWRGADCGVPGKISVVIPCYNYGQYLVEAVNSVLEQTMRPDELIIADDCSTDDSKIIGIDIVEQISGMYSPKIKKVFYHREHENVGAVKNFDIGVSYTTGEYVMLLGADNRMRPTYIEECVKCLEARKNVGVVYTDCAAFGPEAAKRSEGSTWWRNKKREGEFFIWEYFDFDRDLLMQRNYIHGSAMFRRECYNMVGGYEGAAKAANKEDYALWYRILIDNKWDAFYIRKPLLEYRQHSNEQRSMQ